MQQPRALVHTLVSPDGWAHSVPQCKHSFLLAAKKESKIRFCACWRSLENYA